MMQVDVVIAGAGIWGCTLARVLAEAGRRVLVLERRAAVGGNVRCHTDPSNGIEVHTYGSHIFHTGIDRVWNFVNRFTTFNGYQHKVLARHNGGTYFLPLGLALVNQFYGINLSPSDLPAFIQKQIGEVSPASPRNFEEQAISFIGRPLYEAFIRDYTRKQWGTDPRNLPASIIKRLPVRASWDVNYFPDYRQGIPSDGYNAIFDRLLDHPNIAVECNANWIARRSEFGKAHVFYSGPIDELFDYRFGSLPWRSLRFETETLPIADFQGTSVMNYTDADVPYTRIHEFKHFHPENKALMAAPATVICREYPKTWQLGDEPYYPVDNPQSAELLAQYRNEAAKIPNLVVGGRLGAYRYFDMDRSIDDALSTAERFLNQ